MPCSNVDKTAALYYLGRVNEIAQILCVGEYSRGLGLDDGVDEGFHEFHWLQLAAIRRGDTLQQTTTVYKTYHLIPWRLYGESR